MAEDPAVSSIEVDCLERADTSLTESDSSSPGDHDMRRLSVHAGAPWGIDRIDTKGEPAVRKRHPHLWLAHTQLPSAPQRWCSYIVFSASHPRR